MGEGEAVGDIEEERKRISLVLQRSGAVSELLVNGGFPTVSLFFIDYQTDGFCPNDRFHVCVLLGEYSK